MFFHKLLLKHWSGLFLIFTKFLLKGNTLDYLLLPHLHLDLSFLESNSPDILVLCEINLDDSIDSGNFYVRGYLLFIRKDSSTRMYGLAFYVKEGLPFAHGLSLENSADSYVFDWLYLTQCLTSFSPIDHLLRLCAQFFILFHLT